MWPERDELHELRMRVEALEGTVAAASRLLAKLTKTCVEQHGVLAIVQEALSVVQKSVLGILQRGERTGGSSGMTN